MGQDTGATCQNQSITGFAPGFFETRTPAATFTKNVDVVLSKDACGNSEDAKSVFVWKQTPAATYMKTTLGLFIHIEDWASL